MRYIDEYFATPQTGASGSLSMTAKRVQGPVSLLVGNDHECPRASVKCQEPGSLRNLSLLFNHVFPWRCTPIGFSVLFAHVCPTALRYGVILYSDCGVCTIIMAEDLLVVVFGVSSHHRPDKYGAITHHSSSSESVRQPLKSNPSYLNSFRPRIHQFPPLPCLVFDLVKFQARSNFKDR